MQTNMLIARFVRPGHAAGVAALCLAAAVLPTPAAAQASKSPAQPPAAGARQPGAADDVTSGPRPADFAACLARLRPEAEAKGVSGSTFDKHTGALAPDMAVIGFLDAQPEFVTPIWDYLAALVDDERVADGREMLARWREVLARVEAEYGVDPATVVAVWGVESDFGRRFGSRPLLESLSTLSCYGRRQPFFRGEFFTTLKIIQDGDVAPDRLKGSWAGAFGHTQFMPSTFMRLAVDFDGDGRRDLIDSVPDALASTANFLKRAGWRSELPWGFEVKLPAGFDAAAAGRRNKQPASAWAARGVRRVDGARWSPRARPMRKPVAVRPSATTRRPRCCCPPARGARPSWSPATSMHCSRTTRPRAMRWRSRTWPTGCAAQAFSPRRGRPTIRGCRAPSAANCSNC